jgi:hypothetical protein
MHWAGGKPGIALLAACTGAVTPYSILFLYLFCGCLTALYLFLLLQRLDVSFYLAASAVLLWVSSPYFFYYSKTHHLVCVSFYLSGLYFCWLGIQQQKINSYRIGCFLLGWCLLTYYLLITYLPFLFLFFLYCWYKRGVSISKTVLNSVISFLLPVFIFDAAAFGTYLFWGKKNWPVMYSFFGACNWLTKTKSPYNFSIPLWAKVAYQAESFLIWLLLILVVSSFFWFIYMHKRTIQYRFNTYEKYIFMMVLFLPFFFWSMQHFFGNFTALRSLLGIFPLVYGAAAFLIRDFIPLRFQYLILVAVIPWTGYRLYTNQLQLAPQLTTGYAQAVQVIKEHSASVIVYTGQKKLWEQLLSDKVIIPLNIDNDPLEVMHNKDLWNNLVQKLHEYLEQDRSILLVISHTSLVDLKIFKECISQEFMVEEEQQFKDAHLTSLFWFAEHNLSLAQSKINANPVIYVFNLIKI